MKYNLKEVFDLAVAIEKSGYEFYKKAASVLPEHGDFFSFLAKEEIKHDVAFNKLKEETLSKELVENTWDPDGIISVYFNSLNESAIFKKDKDLETLLESSLHITGVIDWAIKREHDTILFYIGLKSTMDSEDDKNIIEKIISEEINHVHILMNKKSEIMI